MLQTEELLKIPIIIPVDQIRYVSCLIWRTLLAEIYQKRRGA